MHREPSVSSKKFLVSFCMNPQTVKYSKLNKCHYTDNSSEKKVDACLGWDLSSPSTPLPSFSAKTVEISSFVVSKVADCVPASPL